VHNAGTFEADWLGVRIYFSGYDVATNEEFVHAAGLRIEVARLEPVWETLRGETKPAHFFWVLAQRPGPQVT
jgi:hypothetical protein